MKNVTEAYKKELEGKRFKEDGITPLIELTVNPLVIKIGEEYFIDDDSYININEFIKKKIEELEDKNDDFVDEKDILETRIDELELLIEGLEHRIEDLESGSTSISIKEKD